MAIHHVLDARKVDHKVDHLTASTSTACIARHHFWGTTIPLATR